MPAAFPGASGWGAEATGGRGGPIRVVSNTDDSGAGSLRQATQTDGAGPAIVVFTTGGVCTLQDNISVKADLTIAGQTAPGGGFTIDGTSSGYDFLFEGDNVILRYLSMRSSRFLLHDYTADDGPFNIIMDHCSFNWGNDDMIGMWYSRAEEDRPDVQDITVQYCFFAQPIQAGATQIVAGGGIGGDNATADHVHEISIHNNSFINVGQRAPGLLKCVNIEAKNNVIYNWKATAMGCGENGDGIEDKSDWIANYLKQGDFGSIIAMSHYDSGDTDSSVYLRGNYIVDAATYGGPLTDPEADNWEIVRDHPTSSNNSSTDHQRLVQQDAPPIPVPETTAVNAWSRVPSTAGNYRGLNASSTWADRRDTFDQAQLDDLEGNTGGISSLPASAGTTPTIAAGTPYTDTDGDGMSDEWEDAFGLDKTDASDGPTITGNGYSNVENFINGTPIEGGGDPQFIALADGSLLVLQ